MNAGRHPAANVVATQLALVVAGALVLAAALGWVTVWSAQPSAPAVATGASTAAAVRTTTSRGTAAGYVATVHVVRSGDGAAAATVLEVALTSESTPASAPAADAVLRGDDGVEHVMPLEITGPGRWTSDRLTLVAGDYQLTARFERQGGRVTVPMPVRVPT